MENLNNFVLVNYFNKNIIIKKTTEKQLFKEINILNKLRHNNIIKMIGYIDNDILFEYVEDYISLEFFLNLFKSNISKYLEDKLELTNYTLIINQLNDGLNFIHNNKIIHGNININNIIVNTKTLNVKYIDLGMSLTEHQLYKGCNPNGYGSIFYKSPKFIVYLLNTFESMVDADFYALSCVFCFLFVGDIPFNLCIKQYDNVDFLPTQTKQLLKSKLDSEEYEYVLYVLFQYSHKFNFGLNHLEKEYNEKTNSNLNFTLKLQCDFKSNKCY